MSHVKCKEQKNTKINKNRDGKHTQQQTYIYIL